MTTYTLHIDEQTFAVEIGIIQGNEAQVIVNQKPYTVTIDDSGRVKPEAISPAPLPTAAKLLAPRPASPVSPKTAGGQRVTAPLPGKILSLLVKAGDKVLAGQVVAVIEAMKMENDITSPVDGTIQEIRAVKDIDVATGDLIMVIG